MYSFAPSYSESTVQQIESLAPRSDESMAWLHVSWRPDWERWCVWQMVPPHAIPPMMWGPDTVTTMRVERVLGTSKVHIAPDQRYRLILNRKHMTKAAWDLHLETGCWPKPFWVVQGKMGGHKWGFTEEEERILRLQGLPEDPPEPGEWDYAPLDRRVLDKILPVRELSVWNTLSRGLNELDERDLDAHERAMMVEANTRLWNWLSTQVDASIEEAGVRMTGEAGGGYRDSDSEFEERKEDFITNTN